MKGRRKPGVWAKGERRNGEQIQKDGIRTSEESRSQLKFIPPKNDVLANWKFVIILR
jgi:hypothetical protein